MKIKPLSPCQGFSLLEVLLVLALMMIFLQATFGYWQQQQYPVKRQLAWLYMQQIALAQSEYFLVHHEYASNINDLSSVDETQVGYDIHMVLNNTGFQVVADVQPHGALAGDAPCWQLQLDAQGNQTAMTQQGTIALGCF